MEKTSSTAMLSKALDAKYWLLWFASSNQYSIIDHTFKQALDAVQTSASKAYYLQSVSDSIDRQTAEAQWEMLHSYLELCQSPQTDDNIIHPEHLPSVQIGHTVFLKIHGVGIALETDDIKSQNIVLPGLWAYQCACEDCEVQVRFRLFRAQGILYLLKDGNLIRAAKQQAYHLIQGSFFTQVLCVVNAIEPQRLIGTLHASTVIAAKASEAVALIGNSGSGKSTLTALLAQHGFSVLADDISALTSDYKILYNPNGISIKAGASTFLQSYYPQLKKMQTYSFNPLKRDIRYLHTAPPKRQAYPCRHLVLVKYTPHAKERFEPLDIKSALEILIPESWMSNRPEHAKAFMAWCSRLKCYKLTYSDINTAVAAITSLG